MPYTLRPPLLDTMLILSIGKKMCIDEFFFSLPYPILHFMNLNLDKNLSNRSSAFFVIDTKNNISKIDRLSISSLLVNVNSKNSYFIVEYLYNI